MKAGAYNRRYYVPTETWTLGSVSHGTSLVGSIRTAVASKRTVRPSPMGVTYGQWDTIERSAEIFDTTYEGKFGKMGRIGPVAHVFPSDRPVYVKHDTGSTEAAINKATRRFVNNSGLGISILESPQSARLIGRRARTFYQAVRLLGKGKFSEFSRLMRSATGYNVSDKHIKAAEKRFGNGRYTSKRASAAWLEFSFGWAPFFQSIYDSVDVALSYEKYDTHRRSAKDGNTRAGFSADITRRRIYNLNQLGLLNPAEILWDRIPLSFVIDWFFPISTLLRIASANAGVSRIHGWKTTEEVTTATIRGYPLERRTIFTRSLQSFGFSNVLVTPANSLWKTITSLALISSLKG